MIEGKNNINISGFYQLDNLLVSTVSHSQFGSRHFEHQEKSRELRVSLIGQGRRVFSHNANPKAQLTAS